MKSAEYFILAYLLNAVWQVPLLYVAGWLTARMLRAAGAATEHKVWVTTLLLQSTIPAWSLLPWESLRVFSFWSNARALPRHADVSVVLAGGTGIGVLWPGWLLTTIATLYLVVIVCVVARFVWRAGSLVALRRDTVPAALTGEAALYWEECCRQFGVRQAALVASTRVAGPVTMGLRHKLVVLPDGMEKTLPAVDLRTVIAHECAHMGRNDFIKNLLYQLVSLPVAFHPVLWLAREKIMQTREMVCDQLAACGIGRQVYARSLLRLASALVDGMPVRTPHTIGIFDAPAFERRLMNLTGNDKRMGRLRRITTLAVCAAFLSGACAIAFALAVHGDNASAAESSSASKEPTSLNVSADIMSKHLVTKTVPEYPVAAKKARIQGKVVLAAVIGKDGAIENLRVVSGPGELQQSALDAVRQWVYQPYLLNGNPIEVKTTINIIYSLAG